MATAAIIEPEQLGSRISGLLPSDRHAPEPISCRRTFSSGSRKRSRCAVEARKPENTFCEQNIFGDIASSQALGQPMTVDYAVSPLKRTLSFEVASLRAAASAAVAECTVSLGVLTAAHPARPSPMRSGRLHPASGSSLDSSQSRNEAGDSAVSSRHRSEGRPGVLGDHHPGLVPIPRLGGSSDPEHRPEDGLLTQLGCPPHGAKAICGRRPRMEDAYTAVPFLLEVAVPADLAQEDLLPPRIATHVKSQPGSPSGSEGSEVEGSAEAKGPSEHIDSTHSASTSPPVKDPPFIETLHFFGVFDGHGGAEAALHCAQTLHQRIAEALSASSASGLEDVSAQSSGSGDEDDDQPASEQSAATQHSARQPGQPNPESSDVAVVDELMDIALDDSGGPQVGKVDGVTYTAARFQSALTTAFNRTDEEFGKADSAALVGTTAVVTLVGSRQLYVANCGDSRAVLCRGGLAIPLTDDHKAAREDETARVEAAGGQILFWNGVRVMGVLAVSRAIGDHCLRPYVIAQPEVTILGRRADDELLLLASDGLWDVLSNQEACTLAKRCLRRARQRGASRQSAARIAATVLTRAAVDRGSRDNVTVLVVDLSSGSSNAEAMARATSAAYSEDGAGEAIENYEAGDNFGRSGSVRPGAFGYTQE